jgi:hypothetical protein
LCEKCGLTLPRPAADAPDTDWQDAVQDSLDKLGALNPGDAIEAMLAIDLVALDAAQRDALRLAVEPAATAEQARLQRASAVALFRSFATIVRLLDRQRCRPAAPERTWADAATELSALWRTAPSRPLAALHSGNAAPDDTPETIVRWIDEITDEEVQIAAEQERREKAGEPPLPRKPGQPIVLYRYKPTDYIHKFSPDPKNWQKYPGFENMTMAKRRAMFGYTYTGPNGPRRPSPPPPAMRCSSRSKSKSCWTPNTAHNSTAERLGRPADQGQDERLWQGLARTVTATPPQRGLRLHRSAFPRSNH